MKKKVLSVVVILCLLASFPAAVFAQTVDIAGSKRPKVTLDGDFIPFEQLPYVKDGVTMAPAKLLLEKLGFSVGWNKETNMITAFKYGKEIKFAVGSDYATIDSLAHALPKPVHTLNDEVYIPLRFIAEMDDRTVKWDAKNAMINIQTNKLKEVSMMVPLRQDEKEDETRKLYAELSKRLMDKYQIDAHFDLTPESHYNDKLRLKIAAADTSDLSFVKDIDQYTSELIESFAWNVDPYLHNYSFADKLSEQAMNEIQAAFGQTYVIPKSVPSVDGYFPVLNEAWLSKFNLAQPTTMDELYIVLTKFAEQGNDQSQYALTGYLEHLTLGSLAFVEHVFNENTSRYELKGEKLVDLAVSDGTRNALRWLREAYADGLLAANFAELTKEQAIKDFSNGKAGVLAMKLLDAAAAEATSKQAFTPLVSLKTSGASQSVTGSQFAYDGAFMVSSLSNASKLEHALATMDALYKIVDDEKEDAQLRQLVKEIVGTQQVQLNLASNDTKKRYEKIESARLEIPTKPFLDKSLFAKLDYKLRSAKIEMDMVLQENKVKVITGEWTIEQWDAYVEALQTNKDYLSIMKVYESN